MLKILMQELGFTCAVIGLIAGVALINTPVIH